MEEKFILVRAIYHLHTVSREDDINHIFPEIETVKNKQYLEDVLVCSELFEDVPIGNLVKGFRIKAPIRLEVTKSNAELFVESHLSKLNKRHSLWNKVINHPSLTFWIMILTIVLVILTILLLK